MSQRSKVELLQRREELDLALAIFSPQHEERNDRGAERSTSRQSERGHNVQSKQADTSKRSETYQEPSAHDEGRKHPTLAKRPETYNLRPIGVQPAAR